MFIQRDNHGRGDRSTRRVLNRRREEIRSNEKKWSRRRIVNTGANRLGTKKTYSSKDTRRVSEYSQRERSSLDEGDPFSLQTRARIPPFSRLLRFLLPLNEERSPFFSRFASFPRISRVSLDLTIYKSRSRRCLSTVFTTDSRRLDEAKNWIPIKSGVKQKKRERERKRERENDPNNSGSRSIKTLPVQFRGQWLGQSNGSRRKIHYTRSTYDTSAD